MHRLTIIPFCLAALAHGAVGQERYYPPADTVFVLLVNPHRMYWIRGTDTLSQPARPLVVETQYWNSEGAQVRVTVRQQQLDVGRRTKVDTFGITPLGAVKTINGKAPGLNGRIDFLPRLPGRVLAEGETWEDTLQSEGGGARRDGAYRVVRTYRVRRIFDSSATRLAEVSATGLVRYRDSWWVDSAAGRLAFINVAGPDTERFVFAVKQGQLLLRSWSMNLTGRGAIPGDSGRMDTTAAGLIAAETEQVISSERAHLLTRPMPGPDTSVTLERGPIFLHTVLSHPQEVEAGMARNDGLVGTTHARFAGGVMQAYEVLWTDTAVVPRRIVLSLSGDSLHIRETGRRDTVLAIPEAWWGVADYAMNELLVPTFMAHPADGVATRFAVYRPYPRHWDVGTASVRPLGDNFVASYRLGTDSLPTHLLITRYGDLLMGENSGPTGAQRVPASGSPRRAQLDKILQTLRR